MGKRIGVVSLFVWLVACPAVAPARFLENWPYERLFKVADLVVLASAVKTETASDVPPAHEWPCEFVAQNTTLKVKGILKGKADGEQIRVLHFKFGKLKMGIQPGTADSLIENGPMFVAFRSAPVTVTAGGRRTVLPTPEYLLFLKRLKDGRYELVSGQIDPVLAVREVSHTPHVGSVQEGK